ncbi:MAG: bifunctional diguanylate cyclase/phosphodiesterase [Spirochaetales bacterium]|nr:bifunctional diguanylate cyclase/phosphodiesterase [Spirochaetales bacterium]
MGSGEDKKSCVELLKECRIQRDLDREHIEQLEKLLNHDPDTGLLQRHILTRRVNKLIQEGVHSFALGILRLDQNYQRIRHTRDRMKVLLYVTTERLKPFTGEENLYQSDRSDEFLFLLLDCKSKEQVEKTINNMIVKVAEPHNPPASDLTFGCNVGVALYPDHAGTVDELEMNAEIALGIHEEKSWNGFIYSPEIGEAHYANQSLEYNLRKCILNNFEGFHVAYQPIVDSQKKLMGSEALMRWDAPGVGAVSPEKFIALAEKSGLINYLGKWILYKALAQVKKWREGRQADLQVSVNLSPIQLEQKELVDDILTALDVLNVPGEALHLELTERAVMLNPDEVSRKLRVLQQRGVEIMLDDFGTGYSSLSALNNFPINTLKIAKEFVDHVPDDQEAIEMIRVIMSISRTFKFTTLAEGIEDQKQFDFLVGEGCRYIQGYITSPPVAAAEFEERFLK